MNKILEHKVNEEYFTLIKNGKKRAELRKFDKEKHSDLYKIDKIKLTNSKTGEWLIFDVQKIVITTLNAVADLGKVFPDIDYLECAQKLDELGISREEKVILIEYR